MGGTLPVLSQALVTQQTELGRKVGALYAVNTFGAVVGVVLAGYVLLPALGNRWTMAIAAIANIAVGILAIAWSRRRAALVSQGAGLGEAAPPEPKRARRQAPGPAISGEQGWGLGDTLTVVGLGISGAVSIVYEVAWTRALALVIGSSTYAFTSMLVAFLVGIAGGSALYSWIRGRQRASAVDFALLQLASALSATVPVMLFERMAEP